MEPYSCLKSFCKRLPKVELHAHLNGSLSENTLQTLYARKSGMDNSPSWCDVISVLDKSEDSSSLNQCFQLFKIAHAVTVSPEAVYLATRDVVKEFAEDGVVYLELRTTPRSEVGVMSKKEYLDSVIKAIKNCQNNVDPGNEIIVKLLVSVNRQEGRKAAEENIKEAMEAHLSHPDIVVGVDLSGNPGVGDFENDFLPLFLCARNAGLKVALHCAEIPNESEIQAMLEFGADRLGHGTCIHPSMNGTQHLWNQLVQLKVPLEVCLTSNVKCQTVDSYDSHHLRFLLPLKHPVAISTDDKGVFATSLSKEYEIAAKTFYLQCLDLCGLVLMAVNASFCSEEEKKLITEILLGFQREECGNS